MDRTTDIDYAKLLSNHSLCWTNFSKKEKKASPYYNWGNGAFIGNGLVGAMVHWKDEHRMVWTLGRTDVWAKKYLDGIDWTMPRIPIGDVTLEIDQPIDEETYQLSLWDAMVKGTIKTEGGSIEWTSFSPTDHDVIVIDLQGEAVEECNIDIEGAYGISPRIKYESISPGEEDMPPKPYSFSDQGMTFSVQKLYEEDDNGRTNEIACVMGWKIISLDANSRRCFVTVTYDDTEEAIESAKCNLMTILSLDFESVVTTHKEWWHRYYSISGLVLDDVFWEGFYWVQMYKLASATRSDKGVIDNQGPWLTETPWPGIWWNLNVQLSYMPMYTSGRLDLAKSLIKVINKNKDNLRFNALSRGLEEGMLIDRNSGPDLRVTPLDSNEYGNLIWVLQCIWRHYTKSLDNKLLKDTIYPVLKEAVSVYMQLMYEDEHHRLHLPIMCSPEYPGEISSCKNNIENTNYDLALLKWGCQTLLKVVGILEVNDLEEPVWHDMLERLTGYEQDDTGLMIGKDVTYAVSHRHYSHLIGIYPLHLITPDEDDVLIRRSLDHWLSLDDALQGYSYTGASCMASILGEGDEAYEYLNRLKCFLHPNTMYTEDGPCIETPLSAAEALHYMVIQDWGEVIRIFPAVPEPWQSIKFSDFLVDQGAYVSAVYNNGTSYIKLMAPHGGTYILEPNIASDIGHTVYKGSEMIKIQDNRYTVQLEASGYIELWASG